MTRTRSLAIACCLLAAGLALAAGAAAAAGPDVGGLLAPASVCPHQARSTAAPAIQQRAMRCMTNFARARSGLEPLAPSKALAGAAGHKADDILRCDEFSHEACGRQFTYWMQHFGYLGDGCWAAAENIAWGSGGVGTVRAIFRAWLNSPGHRENILGPYAEIGVGLRSGALEGHPGAHVWVQEFGSHAC
jgi:uncharacterized protein YkwD